MNPREKVRTLVDSKRFQSFIIGVILVNAACLGLEVSPELTSRTGWLPIVSWITIAIFVIEIILRIYAHGRAFFRDGWSLFDLFVVIIALVPAANGMEVLRVLRVLRILRLLSAVRSMRRVVAALAATIPGMLSIGALLLMMIYVVAVMATQMFAGTDPENFGSLPRSLLTLFQIMTGDNWSVAVARVTDEHPAAWVFFIAYMLMTTYIVLNLFIAVAVEALNIQKDDDLTDVIDDIEEGDAAILAALAELRTEVTSLREELSRQSPDRG